MNYFLNVIDSLKRALIDTQMINTVTFGRVSDVALNKRDIYALAHIEPVRSRVTSNTIEFDISIMAMDLLDQTKADTVDKFKGNDNLQYILQQMHSVLNRVSTLMLRGELFDNNIQITADPDLEPFLDSFPDVVAGWTMNFTVQVPNDMSIC